MKNFNIMIFAITSIISFNCLADEYDYLGFDGIRYGGKDKKVFISESHLKISISEKNILIKGNHLKIDELCEKNSQWVCLDSFMFAFSYKKIWRVPPKVWKHEGIFYQYTNPYEDSTVELPVLFKEKEFTGAPKDLQRICAFDDEAMGIKSLISCADFSPKSGIYRIFIYQDSQLSVFVSQKPVGALKIR